MLELRVDNMTCGHCVKTITQAVRSIDPAAAIEADVGSRRVRIESTHPAPELTRVIVEAGYPAAPA